MCYYFNYLGGNSPFVPSDLNPSTDDRSKSSFPSNIQGIKLHCIKNIDMFQVRKKGVVTASLLSIALYGLFLLRINEKPEI